MKSQVLLNLCFCLTGQAATACALGGPQYAIPINSEYADVQYQYVGSNLEEYLDKALKIKHWRFADTNTNEVKFIAAGEGSDVGVSLELPEICNAEKKSCNHVWMFVAAVLPIAEKFNGVKEEPDPNFPQYTRITNDVQLKTSIGFLEIGKFTIANEIKHIGHRISLTERHNYITAVIEVADINQQHTEYLVAVWQKETSINTCAVRYWAENEATGAAFNNAQWKEWNHDYYDNYQEYIRRLGLWMKPYQIKNPEKRTNQ